MRTAKTISDTTAMHVSAAAPSIVSISIISPRDVFIPVCF